jgi:hypothetical protein
VNRVHLSNECSKQIGALVTVTSESCFDKLATQIENQINPEEITAENEMPPIKSFVERVIL